MINYADLEIRIELAKRTLERIEAYISELRQIAGRSWLEYRADPLLEDVSPLYTHAVAMAVRERTEVINAIAKFSAKLPCQAFLDRFGLEMHEYYREKYPIKRDTRVVDVNYGYPVINYLLPMEPISIFEASGVPSSIDIKRGEARFERWGWAYPYRYVDLAFAPEINVVFHYKRTEPKR